MKTLLIRSYIRLLDCFLPRFLEFTGRSFFGTYCLYGRGWRVYQALGNHHSRVLHLLPKEEIEKLYPEDFR